MYVFAGLALSAALWLSFWHERLRVALVAAPRAASAQADVRAYALNANSRQMLESLRAWPDASCATAVRHMEVHGDQDGSVHFDAQVQDVDALA